MSIEVECVNVRDDRLRLRGVNTGEKAQGLFTVALSSTPTLINRSKDAIETQFLHTEPYTHTHTPGLISETHFATLFATSHTRWFARLHFIRACQTHQV